MFALKMENIKIFLFLQSLSAFYLVKNPLFLYDHKNFCRYTAWYKFDQTKTTLWLVQKKNLLVNLGSNNNCLVINVNWRV